MTPKQSDIPATKRIALGMSGGVDSAVSALLLMRAGYEVVGVTCLFQNDAASKQAVRDAAAVCERLGIAHVAHDGTAAFDRCVVQPFVTSYAQGLTPSPCVACNAQCKLPELMQAATEHGCDQVATGHYARIAQLTESGRFVVKTALDTHKDQSYMLALLSQRQLSQLVLPLGAMTKAEVRIIAEDAGLPVAHKADSQDVCFIDGDYRTFLRERGVEDTPGPIVTRAGVVVGTHQGLSNFTVGQRKGLGVAAPKPYYVIEKRPHTAELVVGFADEAMIVGVRLEDINWQAFQNPGKPLEAFVKLRYRSRAVPCIIKPEEAGGAYIALRSPQPTTAPGQYAVLYAGDTVLGGGMIKEVEQA